MESTQVKLSESPFGMFISSLDQKFLSFHFITQNFICTCFWWIHQSKVCPFQLLPGHQNVYASVSLSSLLKVILLKRLHQEEKFDQFTRKSHRMSFLGSCRAYLRTACFSDFSISVFRSKYILLSKTLETSKVDPSKGNTQWQKSQRS